VRCIVKSDSQKLTGNLLPENEESKENEKDPESTEE
jgi:hypothetical protein